MDAVFFKLMVFSMINQSRKRAFTSPDQSPLYIDSHVFLPYYKRRR